MLPKPLKMSMEQYLRMVDHEIEVGLTGFVSTGEKRERLWAVIGVEEERVADYVREFPCEFRLEVQPQVAYRPCTGHYLCCSVKVEAV